MPSKDTQFKTATKSVPLSAKPTTPNTIVMPLTHGAVTLIDAADAPLVLSRTWHCTSKGYAVDNDHQRLHRIIIGALPGQIVDHINRDRLDNRRSNLRICTPTQNLANSVHAKARLRGVNQVRSGKWVATISIEKKGRQLGTFDTPEEAHAVYRKAHAQIWGEWSPYYTPPATCTTPPITDCRLSELEAMYDKSLRNTASRWGVILEIAAQVPSLISEVRRLRGDTLTTDDDNQ